MTRNPSLQRRLSLSVGIVLVVLLLIGAALIALALHHTGQTLLVERLQHDLDSLTVDADVVDGELQLPWDRLPLVYRQVYSGHYYRAAWQGRSIRSRSLWDTDFDVPSLTPGASWQGTRTGPQGQTLMVLARAVQKPGGTLLIAVAEDLGPLQQALRRAVPGIAVFAIVILGLLLLVQHLIIRTALRPLGRLQGELQRLEEGDQIRLSTDGIPTEVLPLAQRLNTSLELLMARLERSRKTAGNLAHALKTPLAILTQTVDKLPPDPLRQELSEELENLNLTIARELRRARLAGGAGALHRASPTEILAALVDTLRRMYRERHIDVEIPASEETRLAMDPEDVTELLGVLLDNAYKWASSRIRVSVTTAPTPLIAVEDDGPGVPADALPRLTTRGGRLDESRAGSGLGLAIASDIVTHYGGSLEFGRSDLGGLAVRCHLPGREIAPTRAG